MHSTNFDSMAAIVLLGYYLTLVTKRKIILYTIAMEKKKREKNPHK